MTQDDKKALREFMRGFAFTISTIGIIILIVSFISWGDSSTEHSQEAKVVGTYKGCNIIRWNYGPLAEYKYFLHCPK